MTLNNDKKKKNEQGEEECEQEVKKNVNQKEDTDSV